MPGENSRSAATVAEVVKLAKQEPIWCCSELKKGLVALIFNWSRLEDEVRETIEEQLGIAADGGAKRLGLVPFAAVFAEGDLPHAEAYDERTDLEKDLFETSTVEYLVWE